jgi:RNA polymerase sigma-70 factor, ECF subfamily
MHKIFLLVFDWCHITTYVALKHLKQTYREVILLRKIQELSSKEVSEVLGWSEARVNTTLHRALKALKQRLPYVEEGMFSYEQQKNGADILR